MKKKKAIFAVIFIVITISLLLTYIYGNAHKSERPESFPEFETASEDIAVHQDSSGEKYTIKRIYFWGYRGFLRCGKRILPRYSK